MQAVGVSRVPIASGSWGSTSSNCKYVRRGSARLVVPSKLREPSNSRSKLTFGVPRSSGRRRTLVVASVIVSTDAKQQAYELLGLKGGEDKEEIKQAFRRLALRYHPDVSHEEEDTTETFVKLQRAYILLTTNAANGTELLEENFDWSEHDFFWMSKFRKVGVQKTRAQTVAEVRSQISNLKRSPLRAQKRNRRRIVPMAESKEQVWVEPKELDPEKRFRAGPVSARSSTLDAHERLGSQISGLRRVAGLRENVRRHEAKKSDEPHEPLDFLTDATFKTVPVTAEEKRFLRLAKLAQEWRKNVSFEDETQDETDEEGAQGQGDGDETKRRKRRATARAALLAAVQGVAIGAFHEIDPEEF
mmetsp:Transcript_31282/g.68340  ORF Transcript_31282/g.68340 Transcript_31282/m.68340 type:complete len:360 (-) Transcript_31282:2047-3126(-)